MQRNKLIYALSDTTLVVHSAHGRGSGTYQGTVEHLRNDKIVLIYVWADGEKLFGGEEALIGEFPEGTGIWINPRTPGELRTLMEEAKEPDVQKRTHPPQNSIKPTGTPTNSAQTRGGGSMGIRPEQFQKQISMFE